MFKMLLLFVVYVLLYPKTGKGKQQKDLFIRKQREKRKKEVTLQSNY